MDRIKSRNLWMTVLIGAAGVILMNSGLSAEGWKPIEEWLTKVLVTGVGSLTAVDMVKEFKKKVE